MIDPSINTERYLTPPVERPCPGCGHFDCACARCPDCVRIAEPVTPLDLRCACPCDVCDGVKPLCGHWEIDAYGRWAAV